MDEWRQLLYYPLGIIPSVFFTLRFLIQWLQSERQGFSCVNSLFWKLSLSGNVLLLVHYFLQQQFPFALIQTGNAVIAWRNLNLIQSRKAPYAFKTVLIVFCAVLGLLTGVYIGTGQGCWMGVPVVSKKAVPIPGLIWHLIGLIGQTIFASRFWVQWWESEKKKQSSLSPMFWWLSLTGSLISIGYFLQIRDVISILNQSFGMVPYMRNLILMRRKREIA